jgi:hypothetical protein
MRCVSVTGGDFVANLALDLLDSIAYWVFRVSLLIVFVAWLVRHVCDELKNR